MCVETNAAMRDYRGLVVMVDAVEAVLWVHQGSARLATVRLDRDLAREVGTTLIAWVDEYARGIEWETTNGVWLGLEVEQGDIRLTLGNAVRRTLAGREAIDLGQRLIVWAGVDLREVAA